MPLYVFVTKEKLKNGVIINALRRRNRTDPTHKIRLIKQKQFFNSI